MVEGQDYVIAQVRELASGDFEATATLLHGPGHRVRVWIPRTASLMIPAVVKTHMDALRLPPEGPR
jgi:hypothetical protein